MVRSGFWNSLGTDIRTYYNTDFSHLMSLMIKDGIHQNYGEQLVVLPGSGLQVVVQTGECWFNECWVRNDADLQISIDNAPIVAGYKRIDAIAIKIDATNAVRNGTIEYVAGEPGSSPVAPTLTDTDEIHWHLLAYVTVNANATSISASNIENKVGTTGTPFITGILETVDITTLLGQWSSQFNDWMDENNTEFQAWFQHMKDQLDEDAAGHLQNEIDEVNDRLDNLSSDAVDINYDDTTTQLGASNVQTAIEKLKAAFSSALTSLKATPIAQAVGATGNTFASVISTLATIKDSRTRNKVANLTNQDGRRVHSYAGLWRTTNSDGTVRTCMSIPEAGYYDTWDIVGATDAQIKSLGWLIPSGNKAISANGSYDVKANATVSVSVPTIVSVQRGQIMVNGYTHSSVNATISAVDMNRSLVICGIAETSHTNNSDSTTPTVTGQMTSTTNITFRYNNGASGQAVIEYTVITFANATVQRGYLQVSGSSGQRVDMSACPSQKSFGIANCAFVGAPGAGRDSCTPTCGLVQVSEYQFDIHWGSYGTATVHIDWQVVTMA